LERELSIEDWEEVISHFPELGVKRLVFSGGEPTMKNGIERLFSQLAELGIGYDIMTNGFRMESKILEALVKYPPLVVGFSVDGMKGVHNRIRQNHKSWQNCMASVMSVKEAKIPVCIVTTINKWNWHQLEHLAALAHLFEADCWQLQLTFPAGRAKDQEDFLVDQSMFDKIFEQIAVSREKYPSMKIEAADCFAFAPEGLVRDDRWHGCLAGITSIGIDADGNVMPCLAMRSAAFCGNVRETPLKEIWEHSDKLDFNRRFDPDSVLGKCRGCRILDSCRGGCGSFSLAYHGHFHEAPFCYFRKELKDEEVINV
jgi:radical SAM protein with 4Fe4S-binding SPASM domain